MKKTLFFGYDRRVVDKTIADMQEKIQSAESRYNALQEKYEQAERILSEKDAALERYRAELNNYTYMYNQVANKTEHYEKSLTNIGQIYMYAYDNASAIVKTAQKQAGCFMEDISAQADYASKQADQALSEMRQMEIDLQDMVAAINQKTMELQKQIGDLLTQAQTIPSSFHRITKYQDEMNEQVNSRIHSFLQQSKEFLDQNDASSQVQDISDTHPKLDVASVPEQEEAVSVTAGEPDGWYQDESQIESPLPEIFEESEEHIEEHIIANQEQADEQETLQTQLEQTQPELIYTEIPEDPIIYVEEQEQTEISSLGKPDFQKSPVSVNRMEQASDRNRQAAYVCHSANMGQKKADRVRGILSKYSQLK